MKKKNQLKKNLSPNFIFLVLRAQRRRQKKSVSRYVNSIKNELAFETVFYFDINKSIRDNQRTVKILSARSRPFRLSCLAENDYKISKCLSFFFLSAHVGTPNKHEFLFLHDGLFAFTFINLVIDRLMGLRVDIIVPKVAYFRNCRKRCFPNYVSRNNVILLRISELMIDHLKCNEITLLWEKNDSECIVLSLTISTKKK